MESLHLVWSATSCLYPGAGLYFGLARQSEVASLCLWRSKRQMACHEVAPVRALGGRMLPTFYLAIRDPSSIRVKTVEQPAREEGVRYVSLVFERDRAVSPDDAAASIDHNGSIDAAFIITVSLAIAKEAEFVRDCLPQAPEDWTDLFERLCSLGTRRG